MKPIIVFICSVGNIHRFYLVEESLLAKACPHINARFIGIKYCTAQHICLYIWIKKVREKSRECHNYKPQPFRDTKRKTKQTKPNKRKSNKRTKSTKISSLFPKQGNHNAKRTENHKNKLTQGKTFFYS